MRLLVSAFEPFGGRRNNTSADLLRKLQLRKLFPREESQSRRIILPVNFETAWPRLSEVIERWQPDLIVLTGEGKSAPVTLEVAARNVRRKETMNAAIDPGLQETISSAFAEKLAQLCASANGISIEQDPGDYLCNFTYFQCLRYRPLTPAIFLHVRPLPEDGATAELQNLTQLVESVIVLAAETWRQQRAKILRQANGLHKSN